MIRTRDNSGFTIVELMISTAVFGFAILIFTAGIMAMGRQYIKSITSARTQETSRSIIEDVSRTAQLGDNAPEKGGALGGPQSICIDNIRYTYQINLQIKAANEHALYREDSYVGGGCPPNPGFPASPTGGNELLGENMRVMSFDVITDPSITGSPDLVNVIVKVAYGDDDLLDFDDFNGDKKISFGEPARNCRSGIGSNFCATSELAITVKKRKI